MLKKWGITVLVAMIVLSLTGCQAAPEAVPEAAPAATEEAAPEATEEAAPEATDAPEATWEPLTKALITDKELFYQYYNQVTMSDTVDTLTERFGEPIEEKTEEGTSYLFIMDDGYGFVVAVRESGRVQAKIAYYDDVRQLEPITSGTNLEAASMLTKESRYLDISRQFGGNGLEIAQIAGDTSSNPPIQRLFLWMEGDMTMQALFDADGMLLSANQGSTAMPEQGA